jgi:hypothetical protein
LDTLPGSHAPAHDLQPHLSSVTATARHCLLAVTPLPAPNKVARFAISSSTSHHTHPLSLPPLQLKSSPPPLLQPAFYQHTCSGSRKTSLGINLATPLLLSSRLLEGVTAHCLPLSSSSHTEAAPGPNRRMAGRMPLPDWLLHALLCMLVCPLRLVLWLLWLLWLLLLASG